MRQAESIEELAEDPTKYGAPTAEEFSRNKEKYLGRPDDEIAAIDRGDPILKCKQVYYIEADARYRLDSLEQAERIARDMGASLFHDFAACPQLRPNDSGGFYNEVTFRLKSQLEKRRRW